MNNIKKLQGKRFKRIEWGLLLPIIVTTIVYFIISPLDIVLLEIKLLLSLLFCVIVIVLVLLAFSDNRVHNKLEKLSKQLNSRCWILVADTPFPQEYLFDLEHGYLYGAFALNPFSIQRMDLRDVEDVEIVYMAHTIAPPKQWKIDLNVKAEVENALGQKSSANVSAIVCRILFLHGKEEICLWHETKYHHLCVGHQNELAYRENALKIKKLIEDLKIIALAKRSGVSES